MKKFIDKKYYGLILSGAIFILILGYVAMNNDPKPLTPKVKPPITQITGTTGAEMSIRKQNDRSIVEVGDQFDVILSVDSKSGQVYGFDAVIKFNPDVVSYKSFKGIDAKFDFVASVKNDILIVTGILKNDQSAVKLASTPLATLSFIAVENGNADMELVMDGQASTTDSNILNEKSQDVIGKTENMPVIVGNKFIITNTNVNKIGEFDIELLEVGLPPEGCVDCVSSATIRISDKVKSDKLTLSTGGVAGSIHNKQGVFGVVYEVESINNNQVVLYYAPTSL